MAAPRSTRRRANGSKSDLAKYAFAVQRGYGWVASSYRREGYGVAMAGEDTENARRFFAERIAKPKHTYLHGASYGGLVGAKLVESLAKNPDGSMNFDGALFNSGAVGGATLNYQHRVDLRAVYQYYCKNLPRPDEAQYPLWMGIAPDSKMTLKDLDAVVDECTGVGKPAAQRSEQQKKNLAEIIGVMGYPENLLVRHMQAATLLFHDVVERTTGGGNPFDNSGVRYHGSSNDDELNRNVARFTADPAAVALVKADGDPTGKLPIPVVSIHSINDPQVPVEQQSAYRGVVTRRRQRRPPGAGLHRRARPHRPERARARRRARCGRAMGREGNEALAAIDPGRVRSAEGDLRRSVRLASGVHAEALRHEVLPARSGGAVGRWKLEAGVSPSASPAPRGILRSILITVIARLDRAMTLHLGGADAHTPQGGHYTRCSTGSGHVNVARPRLKPNIGWASAAIAAAELVASSTTMSAGAPIAMP